MATYFPTQNGRIKIQAETLLGTEPTNGWVYQAPGTGNNAAGAQGGYYYFKSETLDGSVKSATQGLFGATIYVAEAGLYTLRVRTARDTNNPGDSRNDIWVRIDDHMNSVLPEGTAAIETTQSGYAKLKGASTAWGYARTFSSLHEEDASPTSQVYLTQGFHTIAFAGRSVGLHIDFFELFRNGVNVGVNAPETPAVDGPVLPSAAEVDEDASVVLDVLAGLGSGYAVTAATDPAKGTATVNPDGTIRYTPDADFFGTDTFVFSVRDSLGIVTTQRMTMTVAGTPDAPDAAADSAATVKGTAVAISVLANDGDRDGTAVAINAFDAASAAGGTVTKVGSQLVYTPPAGFTGTDTFTYDVIDPTGRVSERASVAVAVADGPTGGLPIVVGVYDADSDTLVDLLADGDVLDAALLDGTATFAVSVVAGSALDGRVGSARLTLSGDATATRTESGAPYSLFGDKDGDFSGSAIGAGDYRLKVELFAKAGGKGALLDSFDFDFGVAEAPAPAPLRVGLYDADTDTLVDVLEDGDVLSAALLDGAMTFAVSAVEGGALDGRIGSVKLRLSGDALGGTAASRTETGAPYSLFGDKDGDLKGGTALAAGSYAFEVDVYSGAGGKGTLIDSFDYAFTVTDPLLA